VILYMHLFGLQLNPQIKPPPCDVFVGRWWGVCACTGVHVLLRAQVRPSASKGVPSALNHTRQLPLVGTGGSDPITIEWSWVPAVQGFATAAPILLLR